MNIFIGHIPMDNVIKYVFFQPVKSCKNHQVINMTIVCKLFIYLIVQQIIKCDTLGLLYCWHAFSSPWVCKE